MNTNISIECIDASRREKKGPKTSRDKIAFQGKNRSGKEGEESLLCDNELELRPLIGRELRLLLRVCTSDGGRGERARQ